MRGSTQQPGNDGPITNVREDMQVRDAAGDDIGTVELVRMGDPEAATAAGQQRGATLPQPMDYLREAFDGQEPDLPEQFAMRLARTGFVKIDTKGLFARDTYVSPEQIDRVADDVVHLTVRRDELSRAT